MEEHAPPTIHILPTIFGERHAPHQMGAATNINQVAVFGLFSGYERQCSGSVHFYIDPDPGIRTSD
jgi:hypothetical protein